MIKNNVYTLQLVNNTLTTLKTRLLTSYLEFFDIRVPYSWYNINEWNNAFVLTDSGANNFNITLTNGQYSTGTLFAAEVQTQLLAAGSLVDVYTCTYSTVTKLITISETSGPNNFGITWAANGLLRDQLGYTIDLTAAASYVAPNIFNTRFAEEIFVKIDQFNLQMPGKVQSLGVPINDRWYNFHGFVTSYSFGEHIEITFDHDEYIPDKINLDRKERIDNLTLSVYDSRGLLLPMNGQKILIRFKNL